METQWQDEIDTFKAITGTSDSVAFAKLQEHRGDLNAAINAHFSEADRVNMPNQSRLDDHQDLRDIDNPYPQSYLHGERGSNSGAYLVSLPRETREIPIEVRDASNSSQPIPTVEDVTESVTEQGYTAQGSIIIDHDGHNDSRVLSGAVNVRNFDEFSFTPAPSAPPYNYPNADDDIEEQMVRAAIEASKQEVYKYVHL